MQNIEEQKTEKMTLKDYYARLEHKKPPKQSFIDAVAKLCNVTDVCVRNWVWGVRKPRKEEHIKILEELTGIERKYLWK